MSEELKPCPWCGMKAEYVGIGNDCSLGLGFIRVRCSLCHGGIPALYKTHEKAATAWNCRTGNPVTVEDLREQYEAEHCNFDDPATLADHASRYALTMPDSHAKLVMHCLAGFVYERLGGGTNG